MQAKMRKLTSSQERWLYEQSPEAWGAYKAVHYASPERKQAILNVIHSEVKEVIRGAYHQR